MATIYFLSNSFMPGVLAITRVDPEILSQKPPFNFEVISKYQTFDSGEILPILKERLTDYRISDEDVYYGVDPMVAEAELRAIIRDTSSEFGPETNFLEPTGDDNSDCENSGSPHLHKDLTPSEIELIELQKAYKLQLQEQEATAALEKQKEELAERERIAQLEILNLKAKMAGYDSYDQQQEINRLDDDARLNGYVDRHHKELFDSLGGSLGDELKKLDERIMFLRSQIAKFPTFPMRGEKHELSQCEMELRVQVSRNPLLSRYLKSYE